MKRVLTMAVLTLVSVGVVLTPAGGWLGLMVDLGIAGVVMLGWLHLSWSMPTEYELELEEMRKS